MCRLYEPCDVWNEDTRHARKQHTCAACERTIEKGDDYIRIFSVYEGEIDVYKVHLRCHAVGLKMAAMCEMWNPELLAEDLLDHDFDVDASFASGELVAAG